MVYMKQLYIYDFRQSSTSTFIALVGLGAVLVSYIFCAAFIFNSLENVTNDGNHFKIFF